MSREPELFLDDIRDACRKIQTYSAGLTLDQFRADELRRDAIIRNLEVIGEAAKALPPEWRARMPGIDWKRVCGMRDVIAHGYFGLSDDILWDVVTVKVPELAREVAAFSPRRGA
jgi:uncharacterized protein with HEPN domain